MSSYFDEAAEEGEPEENELGGDPEQEPSGDDIQNSEGEREERGNQAADSSEEESSNNEYDLNDKFIAQEGEDEEDEDDEGIGGERRKKRHKRRREKSPELDDEDYQLLEDNQVTGIRRKPKNARKRIRKQQDTQNKTEAQRLQEDLFGLDVGDGGLEDDFVEEARPRAEEDDFAMSEDEMDDFIDDGRRTGQVKARRAPKGVSTHGIEEMQDIFGDVDDLLEMYAEKRATVMLGKEVEEEEGLGEDDPDDIAAFEARQRARKAEKRQQMMEAAIEPELREKLMMMPLDDRIRETDAPERFQMSGQEDLKGAFTEDELKDAARFITEQLIGPPEAERTPEGESAAVPAKKRRARYVLEDGILEVDGKPRDGVPRPSEGDWNRDELKGNITDLSRGQRGLKVERSDRKRQEWRSDENSRNNLMQSIVNVLTEMWDQRHEIPLIACFRKEQCGELLSVRKEDQPGTTSREEVQRRRKNGQPDFEAGTVQAKHRRLRRWDVLWAVYDLSSKWRALVKRKKKRVEVYKASLDRWQPLASEEDPRVQQLCASIQSCIDEAVDANSMEALDDIDLNFKLVTSGLGDSSAEEAALGVRRAQRSTAYSLLKQAGLDEVVSAMAMSAAQLGENLSSQLKRNVPVGAMYMPNDLAYNHVNEEDIVYNTPEKVLERCRQIHVMELVNEPRVRAFVRRLIVKHMVTSSDPTPAGETQLDAFHPYGAAKRLRKMPASQFDGSDLFLKVHLAQKEGLISVTSEVEDLETKYVKPMLELYESSDAAATTRDWNLERQAIIREVVQKLVPQLQEEVSGRLLGDAREVVVEQFSDALWKYASLPPVQMKLEDGDVVEKRRLAACCWGEGRPATCMVMLDEHGSLVDILYLPSFSGVQRAGRLPPDYNIAEDPRKAADVKRVVDFCRENRPQAIFVGARNLSCKVLKEDMSLIGDFILDAHAQILTSGHDTGTIEVCYAEETIADLWANSAAAREEFPDHPDVVRRAVALGRFALEPLAVLASLCNSDGKEILSLNLQLLQSHVPEAELLRAAERCLMTVIAQVGADMNIMASNVWQAASLQYVAGLGPRKAQSLLQAVQADEFVTDRVSLWKDIWKPGNAVFRNCGAFLKITTKARNMVNAEVAAIDSLRIEPLSYALAFKVAGEAVHEESGNQQMDLKNVEKAIEHPELVESTNLEELHQKLADESSDPEAFNCISTLVDIGMEFILPNMEVRHGNPIEVSTRKENQFWWMVGESSAMLKPGRRVEALVKFVGNNEARCVLPELDNLEAILGSTDISSRVQGPVIPSDHLKVGQVVNARIKVIRAEEFCVDLTTTSSDLNDEEHWEEEYCKRGNKYYHVQTQEERKKIEAEKRKQRSKVLTKRTIDHPNFQNISMAEAVQILIGRPKGDAIFRPSSKSTDLICLSIKLHDGQSGDLIIHRDVKEGRKRGGQLTLGHPLKIQTSNSSTITKEETFEDLDEIVARYVEPLFDNFQKVVKHRKYREGSWAEVKDSLRREAATMAAGGAIYCMCIEEQHPGILYIGFVLPTIRRTPRRDFFSVMPDGYYFRQRMFTDVERMLNHFKRNPLGKADALPPGPPPNDLAPPQLQIPAAPVQGSSYGAYPQEYMQSMPGHYQPVATYEPVGQSMLYPPAAQPRSYQ